MFSGPFRRISVSDLLRASNSNTRNYNEQDNGDNGDKSSSPSLKRVYKLTDLIYLGICNVVGSGIYVLAGTAGKDEAGSGLLISLVIGLISAGISAMCYAEFASRIPVIGGSYIYIYTSSGEILGFITGFVKILTQMCSCAINSIGAIGYLRSFIQSLYDDDNKIENLNDSIFFGKDLYGDVISINLLAPCLIFIFMCITLWDIGLSSKFMNITATWNILLLILFCIAGLMLFDWQILTKPCDEEVVIAFNEECPDDANNSFMPFGFEGIIFASTITFWSFAGSENIASVAEEAINPTRDIPRAIYITLFIVFILFETVTLALFGMVPFQTLDSSAPLASAFAEHDEYLLQRICAFGAFSTMSILLFAKLIASPRYMYRIGVDGLLPKLTAYIHPQRQTPFNAILIFGLIAMTISIFFDLATVLSFAATTTLLEYTMTCVGSLVMRYCPPSLSPYDSYNNNDQIDKKAITDIQLTSFWTDRKIFLLIWFYFILCLFTAYIGFNYEYFVNDLELDILYIVFMIICGGILLIIFCIIIYLDINLPWKDWIRGGRERAETITFVPFAPVTQLILIALNSSLIASGGIDLLLQVLVLLFLAIIVYFGYGYKHSKFGNKYRETLLEMK